MSNAEEFLGLIGAHEAAAKEASGELADKLAQVPQLVKQVALGAVKQRVAERHPRFAERNGYSKEENEQAMTEARVAMDNAIEGAITAQTNALLHDYAADQLRTAMTEEDRPT